MVGATRRALGFGYRIADEATWRSWLARVSGHDDPLLEVVQRRLRVADDGVTRVPAAPVEPAAAQAPVLVPAAQAPVEGVGRAGPGQGVGRAGPGLGAGGAGPARCHRPGGSARGSRCGDAGAHRDLAATEAAAATAPDVAQTAPLAPEQAAPPAEDPVVAAVLDVVERLTGYPRALLDLDLDLDTTCGDITVFSINQTTGRLSLVVNAQVTAANGQPIPYFPVPANPVDFVFSGTSVLTLTGAPTPTSYPYVGASTVFPYAYSNGQLTLSQYTSQALGIKGGTAIVNAAGVIYVLDNEPFTITATGGTFTPATYPSEILPFTVGSGGALQAEPSGVIPDAATLSNPIDLMVESKSKFLYVANQGNNVIGPNPASGISAYFLTTAPAYQLSFVADQPFSSGSGPQCIVEDPSNQFIYEANQFDSTVTGRVLDPNTGDLVDMRVLSTYKLEGPATWCFVDGRTS